MRTEEVEPYVRQVCRERLKLAIDQNEDLRQTNPATFADLCRDSIRHAELSLSRDAVLREMCQIAYLDLTKIVADEKEKALTITGI